MAFCWLNRHPSTICSSPEQPSFSRQTTYFQKYSPLLVLNKAARNHVMLNHTISSKSYLVPGLRRAIKASSRPNLSRGIVNCASSSGSGSVGKLNFSGYESNVYGEPFRGKPGSFSFSGTTHQLIEESKTVSAPFKENTGSLVWILAPIAFISSLMLPQFLFGFVSDGLLQDEVLSEIASVFLSEVMFYVGLGTFLSITNHVQKPYLQFSSKEWSLITGLKGYLTCSFFIMGFKVFAPLLAVYVTWPTLGLSALVAVAPFLAGCLVQFIFEKLLDERRSSCWPLVPILFETYRLYQLTKAVHFVERLVFAMRGTPITPELLERHGALAALVVTFQILGLMCLWSLLTFLQRLFPSRPVVENY